MTDFGFPPLIQSRKGFYRHYKGGRYEVIDTVRHSETCECMTLYRAMYGAHALWVRPTLMFNGDVVFDGKSQPRFAWIADA